MPGEKAISATTTMIEPIKRFRIGKSLLLSISQLQMQFGISPLETHKPRLKMSPSRSKDDIRRRCVPTTHSCSSPLHQRQVARERPPFRNDLLDCLNHGA